MSCVTRDAEDSPRRALHPVVYITVYVPFCRSNVDVPDQSDHIHLYKGAGGRAVPRASSDDLRDAPAVVCSELPTNPRGSMFLS